MTLPLAGERIVTLQSCTLPDYSRRLVVRAARTRLSEEEKRR